MIEEGSRVDVIRFRHSDDPLVLKHGDATCSSFIVDVLMKIDVQLEIGDFPANHVAEGKSTKMGIRV